VPFFEGEKIIHLLKALKEMRRVEIYSLDMCQFGDKRLARVSKILKYSAAVFTLRSLRAGGPVLAVAK
jgi:hypothetical protein